MIVKARTCAVALPRGLADDPDEGVVLGLGRRERAEVVLAHEQRRRGGERVFVHGARQPERAPPLQR